MRRESKIRKAIGVAILNLLILPLLLGVAYAQRYLCVTESSVGFADVGGGWRAENFKPTDRFIVAPVDLSKQFALASMLSTKEKKSGLYTYGEKEIGSKYWVDVCADLRIKTSKYAPTFHSITCDTGFNNLTINTSNLRFQEYFDGGYTSSRRDTDTPQIDIGHCTTF